MAVGRQLFLTKCGEDGLGGGRLLAVAPRGAILATVGVPLWVAHATLSELRSMERPFSLVGAAVILQGFFLLMVVTIVMCALPAFPP